MSCVHALRACAYALRARCLHVSTCVRACVRVCVIRSCIFVHSCVLVRARASSCMRARVFLFDPASVWACAGRCVGMSCDVWWRAPSQRRAHCSYGLLSFAPHGSGYPGGTNTTNTTCAYS
jgi:hypothetical protein